MTSTQEQEERFNGLTMPVFTAFGWAGEETALKYAQSQLTLFIKALHESLPDSTRGELPVFGFNAETQTAYLAADSDAESNVHVSFLTRATSLEIQLALTAKRILTKGWKQIEKDPGAAMLLLKQLESGWILHVQQLQVDEETGEASFYHDLFKDDIMTLTEETAVALFSKAAYLNGDDRWVVPISISQRIPAQQAATMGTSITAVISERIAAFRIIMRLMSGRPARRKISQVKPRAKTVRRKKATPKKPTSRKRKSAQLTKDNDQFEYVAELKPLHIRRGFINLTSDHWPFFAKTARTATREAIILGDELRDEKDSSIWRLQPTDQARIVLGEKAQRWLEDQFMPGDQIVITANKVENGIIEITLEATE